MSTTDDAALWVELRCFNDPVEAELARQFLVANEIPVATRGNSPEFGVLNRFNSIIDIRLDVRPADVGRARELLLAMATDTGVEQPFRGPMSTRHPEDTSWRSRRSARAGFVLAFAVPIGGGHFYARHHVAGTVFAVGVVGSLLTMFFTGSPGPGVLAMLLVVFDALLSFAAVRRFNDGRVPHPARQAAVALAAFVVAAIAARLLAPGSWEA